MCTPNQIEEPALKGAKALASGFPAANAGAWGAAEAALDVMADTSHPPITPLHALMRNPAWHSARAVERLRHEQEAVAKEMMPQGDSLTEQAIYAGLQSLTQNTLTLPLSILTRRPNTALTAMAGLTFGKSYGEARDTQAVPKAARAQIEAALSQNRMPVNERNIRLVYGEALKRLRAPKDDPGAAGP